jgi:hypothetical protein
MVEDQPHSFVPFQHYFLVVPKMELGTPIDSPPLSLNQNQKGGQIEWISNSFSYTFTQLTYIAGVGRFFSHPKMEDGRFTYALLAFNVHLIIDGK